MDNPLREGPPTGAKRWDNGTHGADNQFLIIQINSTSEDVLVLKDGEDPSHL